MYKSIAVLILIHLLGISPYLSEIEKREIIILSRKALETYLRDGRIMDVPDSLSDSLYRRQNGLFVTIKVGGKVKGCQGTLIPAKGNLLEEIIENTIRAATSDRRYPPISLQELPETHIQIALVKEWYEIDREDKLRDPNRFGLIVENGERMGIILPGEAKTSSWQYMKACKLAGVRKGDSFRLFVFEALIIKE